MNDAEKNKTKTGFRRTLMEWGGMAAVIGILYVTGLHTEVLGTMQRALLWTGLFDAEGEKVTAVDGPVLPESAYAMRLTGPDGEEVRLGAFRGKVLFVNIWASWCPPCVAEMPTIETLYDNVADNENIKFLLISLDEDPQKAAEFMHRKGFSMPFYFPSSGLPQMFRSPYIPATYVVSGEGKVIYKHEGIADYSSAEFRDWLIRQAEK